MNRRNFIRNAAGLLVPACAGLARGQGLMVNPYRFGGGGGGGSFSFVENFETPTTGYDNSGWTTTGSANPAADAAALGFAAGQGTQSLYAASGGIRGAHRANALTGEQWFFWKAYHVTGTVDDWHFYGNGGSGLGVKLGFSSGRLYLDVGGSGVLSAGNVPLDQWVGVWLRYKTGTGDCASDAYFAAAPFTKPGSPQCTLSGLTNTAEPSNPQWLSRSTYAVAWDRIIINQTAIGDNP